MPFPRSQGHSDINPAYCLSTTDRAAAFLVRYLRYIKTRIVRLNGGADRAMTRVAGTGRVEAPSRQIVSNLIHSKGGAAAHGESDPGLLRNDR
jgi:hypothetical protein